MHELPGGAGARMNQVALVTAQDLARMVWQRMTKFDLDVEGLDAIRLR